MCDITAIKVLILGKSIVQMDKQGNIVTEDDDENDINIPPPFVSGPVIITDGTSNHSPVKDVGPSILPSLHKSSDLPVTLIDEKDESPSIIDISDEISTAGRCTIDFSL